MIVSPPGLYLVAPGRTRAAAGGSWVRHRSPHTAGGERGAGRLSSVAVLRSLDVHLEVGKQRVFATSVGWPGWARSGRDEGAALDALVAYGPRYAKALASTRLRFSLPRSASDLKVVEHVVGDATTDFGVPSKAPATDDDALDVRELERLTTVLKACWGTFDTTADSAGGKALRKGPRGGGRELTKIRGHVLEGDCSYLANLGGKLARSRAGDVGEVRHAFLQALAARVRGDLPDRGPRGGRRWTPRYAVRRSAWHALDHAWEIEDRADDH